VLLIRTSILIHQMGIRYGHPSRQSAQS